MARQSEVDGHNNYQVPTTATTTLLSGQKQRRNLADTCKLQRINGATMKQFGTYFILLYILVRTRPEEGPPSIVCSSRLLLLLPPPVLRTKNREFLVYFFAVRYEYLVYPCICSTNSSYNSLIHHESLHRHPRVIMRPSRK